MKKKSNNYAFIDSQNLNLSIRSALLRVIMTCMYPFNQPGFFVFLNRHWNTKMGQPKATAMRSLSFMQ